MFGDNNEKEKMHFDSVPNISFNNEGQPVGDFGMIPSTSNDFLGDSSQNNGQFVPPAAMSVMDNSSNNDIFNNNLNNNTNFNTIVEPVNMGLKGDFNMFKCNICNSTFGVSNGGVVEQCMMCRGHDVVNVSYNGNRIDGFIPFVVPKSKAIEIYKSKIKSNPIIPFCFKKSSTINSIKKVYIPGYLYNVVTSGEVNIAGADHTPGGNKKFDLTFNTNVEHCNLFYKSSSKINERVFNAIGNYNFNNLTMFSVENIGQCFYLECDVNPNDLNSKVEDNCRKHVLAITRRKVNHQMKKVQGDKLVTIINNVQNILVPVYLLNVRYGGKDYMYVMNGENGESSLDVTSGILEMIIFGLIVGLIVFGISVGLSMLF